MDKQEWAELVNTTVTVGGVQKRLGACTADDLRALAAEHRERARSLQQEAEVIRRMADAKGRAGQPDEEH